MVLLLLLKPRKVHPTNLSLAASTGDHADQRLLHKRGVWGGETRANSSKIRVVWAV